MKINSNPKLIVYTGPMFSSKTTNLLMKLEKYERKGFKVKSFKPLIDQRYSNNKISTHTGFNKECSNIENGKQLLKEAQNFDVIGIDELFMIPGAGKAAVSLYLQGKIVIVSSIQLSDQGEPFEEMVEIFPWATYIKVCSAVCNVTKNKAYFTISNKNIKNSKIYVGGQDLYEPRAWPLPSFIKKTINENNYE
jgi:thymidine kinase